MYILPTFCGKIKAATSTAYTKRKYEKARDRKADPGKLPLVAAAV